MKKILLLIMAYAIICPVAFCQQTDDEEWVYHEFKKPKTKTNEMFVLSEGKTDFIVDLAFRVEKDIMVLGVSYYKDTEKSPENIQNLNDFPTKEIFVKFYEKLLGKFADEIKTTNDTSFINAYNREDERDKLFNAAIEKLYTKSENLIKQINNSEQEENFGLDLADYTLLKSYSDSLDGERDILRTSKDKITDAQKTTTNKKIKEYKYQIRRINERRLKSVYLTGNALLNSSANKSDKADATTGVGIKVKKAGTYDFLATVTVTQSNDTIAGNLQADYGKSILTPGVRRFSMQSSFREYSFFANSKSKFMRKLGTGLDLSITRYNWSYQKDSTSQPINKIMVPVAIDFMVPYTWINISKPKNDIKISTEIGYAMRILAGDMNIDERVSILNTQKVCFSGVQAGFNMRYNGLRIFYYVVFFESSTRIQGLTHGQAFAGISFTGNITNIGSSSMKKDVIKTPAEFK